LKNIVVTQSGYSGGRTGVGLATTILK